jgi:putative endonuclease
MTLDDASYGRWAEEAAVSFLKRRGYRIIDRNFRIRSGEIDIVASDGGTVAIIEVKARRRDDYGGPEGGLTPVKRRKITRVAEAYLAMKKVRADVRFDVVFVRGTIENPLIELIQNAFDAE